MGGGGGGGARGEEGGGGGPPRQHVVRVGEGLAEVPGDLPRGVVTVSLHGNAIPRLDGGQLSGLAHLVELNVSSNALESLAGLVGLVSLRRLNAASNRLTSVEGLAALPRLERLILRHNRLEVLQGFRDQPPGGSTLREVDLRDNRVSSLVEVSALADLPRLENLLLGAPGGSPSGDNSVCHLSDYRSAIVAAVPGLRELDSEEVAGASGERAGEGPGAPAQRVSPPPVVLPFAPPPPAAAGATSAAEGTAPQVEALPATTSDGGQGMAVGVGGAVAPQARPGPTAAIPATSTRAAEPPPAPAASLPPPSSGTAITPPVSAGAVLPDPASSEGFVLQKKLERLEANLLRMMQSTQASAPGPLPRLQGPAKKKASPRDAAVQTAADSAFLGRLETEAQALRGEVAALGEEFQRRQGEQGHLMAEFRGQLEDQVRLVQVKAAAEHKALRRKYEDALQAHSKGRSRVAFLTQEVAQAHRVAEAAVEQFEKERAAGGRREEDLRRAEERYAGALREQAGAQSELARTQALLQKEKTCRQEAAQRLEELQQENHAAQQNRLRLEREVSELAVRAQKEGAETALGYQRELAESQAEAVQHQSRATVLERELRLSQEKEQQCREDSDQLRRAVAGFEQQYEHDMGQLAAQCARDLESAGEAARAEAEERLRAHLEKQRLAHEAALSAAVETERREGLRRAETLESAARADREVASARHKEAVEAAASELGRIREEASEAGRKLCTAEARSQEQEGLLEELMQVVRTLQTQGKTLKEERGALLKERKEFPKKKFHILEGEVQRLGFELQAAREERAQFGERVQAEAAEAENRSEAARRAAADLHRDGSRKLEAAEAALARCEELKTEAGDLRALLERSGDENRVKDAQIDDNLDTIAKLKQALKDDAGLLEEVQESHGRIVRALEEENDMLREQIADQEAAVDRLQDQTAEDTRKAEALEEQLVQASEAVQEKEGMILYVREEVERVQGLFKQKEDALKKEVFLATSERDKAVAEAKALSAAPARVQELEAELEREKLAAAQLEERYAEKDSELLRASNRTLEVEGEMRLILATMNHQKKHSAHKVKQLEKVLHELHTSYAA